MWNVRSGTQTQLLNHGVVTLVESISVSSFPCCEQPQIIQFAQRAQFHTLSVWVTAIIDPQ